MDSEIVFMNIIAPQFIRDYFLEKFKDNYKMSSGESELIVPSVYISDDYKRHMSINLDTGLWQCFKSGNKGNFTQLSLIHSPNIKLRPLLLPQLESFTLNL